MPWRTGFETIDDRESGNTERQVAQRQNSA